MFGLLAYMLDGIAWIFYYQSIVYGPISIVGTLSAAYPALTVILARFVCWTRRCLTTSTPESICVVAGCLGLACSPHDTEEKDSERAGSHWRALRS